DTLVRAHRRRWHLYDRERARGRAFARRVARAQQTEAGRYCPGRARRFASAALHAAAGPRSRATRDARNPPRPMSGWARSSLRTKIFVAFSALILAVLLATLSLTQLIVSREARRTLSHELLTTGQVFNGLLSERATRLQNSSVLLASDFALKR